MEQTAHPWEEENRIGEGLYHFLEHQGWRPSSVVHSHWETVAVQALIPCQMLILG